MLLCQHSSSVCSFISFIVVSLNNSHLILLKSPFLHLLNPSQKVTWTKEVHICEDTWFQEHTGSEFF